MIIVQEEQPVPLFPLLCVGAVFVLFSMRSVLLPVGSNEMTCNGLHSGFTFDKEKKCKTS